MEMLFLTHLTYYFDRGMESSSLKRRQIVNILMDSPLYFSLPLDERKEIIERIETEVSNNVQ